MNYEQEKRELTTYNIIQRTTSHLSDCGSRDISKLGNTTRKQWAVEGDCSISFGTLSASQLSAEV